MYMLVFMLCKKVIRKKMEVVVIYGVFFKALFSIVIRFIVLYVFIEVDFIFLVKNFIVRN